MGQYSLGMEKAWELLVLLALVPGIWALLGAETGGPKWWLCNILEVSFKIIDGIQIAKFSHF